MEGIPHTPPDPTPPESKPQNQPKGETTWVEEIEIAGSQLVERVKELIAEGNVRRLVIRGADNQVIMEIPLTAGVAVGGLFTMIAPVLAAIGALAALIAAVKVEIIRGE
jgi:hypothetical protein